MFILDPCLEPFQEFQAVGRAQRRTQQKPVRVVRLVAKGGWGVAGVLLCERARGGVWPAGYRLLTGWWMSGGRARGQVAFASGVVMRARLQSRAMWLAVCRQLQRTARLCCLALGPTCSCMCLLHPASRSCCLAEFCCRHGRGAHLLAAGRPPAGHPAGGPGGQPGAEAGPRGHRLWGAGGAAVHPGRDGTAGTASAAGAEPAGAGAVTAGASASAAKQGQASFGCGPLPTRLPPSCTPARLLS